MATVCICSVDDCDKPASRRGYCENHYRNWMRSGHTSGSLYARSLRRCSVAECDRRPMAKTGLCPAHYRRTIKHGDPLGGGAARGETTRYIRETALPYLGDDCLQWPYSKDSHGYGTAFWDGVSAAAHRIVCREVNGEPPSPRHYATHSCGNGHLGCVTPKHLRWATPKQNSADKKSHGTFREGESVPISKLKIDQIREIRTLHPGLSMAKIAAQYGVTPTTIYAVIKRITWRHVP